MRVSVILPTYNERDNISVLIPLIHQVLASRGIDYEIVVVDDNSPDGTAEVARELSKQFNVKVILRPGKLGLTSAIYDGIRASSGDYIIVMDSDLQHPPDAIPSLIERARDCDVVVGSRYVEGGSIEGFPLVRRIISRGSIALAKLLVPRARGVKDPVSGFFLIKREVAAGWKPIEPRGYKALVEILSQLDAGVSVCEEPYRFRGRERGASKLGRKVILSYLRMLARINPAGFAAITILAAAALALLALAIASLI